MESASYYGIHPSELVEIHPVWQKHRAWMVWAQWAKTANKDREAFLKGQAVDMEDLLDEGD